MEIRRNTADEFAVRKFGKPGPGEEQISLIKGGK